MKKRNIILLGVLITILVLNFLYFITSTKGEIPEGRPSINSETQSENKEQLNEIEAFSSLLFQEGGFFEQVDHKLNDEGYEYQMLLAVYSKDDIQVKYILENMNATEPAQKEIQSIFFETVASNSLHPESFHVKISDRDDGKDW